jgi:hypothetical protein
MVSSNRLIGERQLLEKGDSSFGQGTIREWVTSSRNITQLFDLHLLLLKQLKSSIFFVGGKLKGHLESRVQKQPTNFFFF